MLYYGCDYYPEQWPESRWAEDARLMQDELLSDAFYLSKFLFL